MSINITPVITSANFYQEAMTLHRGYEPNPEVIEHAHRVDLTSLSSAAGIGKDTIIGYTQLPQIISDTDRQPRSNNGKPEENGVEYYFRNGNLQAYYDDIAAGRYVQFGPGPNNRIYGSRGDHYPAEGPAMIDVVAASIPGIWGLEKYMRSVQCLGLVLDPNIWMPRLQGRGDMSKDDLDGRKRQALESTQQLLDFGPKVLLIENRDSKETAATVIQIALRDETAVDTVTADYVRCGNIAKCMIDYLRDDLGLARAV
jgi:hypothetical protein